jgi:phenylacetate-coenzyme A ligase PaaK-like adenylate-forming protein
VRWVIEHTIAPATGDYSIDRMRHVSEFQARMPAEMDKLRWPLERLHALRDARLRALLRVAKARSPWHARRLRDVDPDRVTGQDLGQIPPMTREDVQAHWDEIVTDRRLTLEKANRHLENVVATGPAYLLDEYHLVASSGSTGQRTVFAFDFSSWLEGKLVMARNEMAISRLVGPGGPEQLAVVAAPNAVHASGAMFQTFGTDAASYRAIPSTLPLADIVHGLNAYQPDAIQTYPSILRSLTREARADRLRIDPRYIMCGGEPLTAGIRHAADMTFDVPIVDVYASTEGFWMAVSHPFGGPPLHLIEDIAVYEPVDNAGRPVPPGVEGDRLLLTNVVNQLLPLIRYELTDRVQILDFVEPGPWTGRRIAPVDGRVEQVFTYSGGVSVNPEVFDAPLDAVPAVLESQVLQTSRGATIRVRATADANLAPVQAALESSLRRFGVADPMVRIERVADLQRSGATGKLNRFVALAQPLRGPRPQ